MNPWDRRTGSVTLLLVGTAMLIGLAALIVLAPVAKCSNCDGHAVILWTTGERPKDTHDPRVIMACARCKATGRITLLNLWIQGSDVAN